MKIYYSILFCFIGLSINAQDYFEMSPRLEEAYKNVLSLKFSKAEQALKKVAIEEPDNALQFYVANYLDILKIYIDEDKALYKKLDPMRSKRIELIKRGDKNSPFFLFSQAEIRLQWAIVKGKLGEYFNAALEVRRAFKLLEENAHKFPDFMPNKKSLGILHALVGTIPDEYKWGAKLIGMSGTIAQGQREIEEVLQYAKNHEFAFEEETIVMYAMLLLNLGNKGDDAWQTIQSTRIDPTTTPLGCFALANVAIRTGQNDKAIRILKNRPQGADYYDFHFLDLMLGEAKLNRLDTDADKFILGFIEQTKSQSYIKEAYQKLAWFELINKNMDGYQKYMYLCSIKGNTQIESDKKAMRAATTKEIPNVDLLKARLLFDGGYYQAAYDILEKNTIELFSSPKNKLEYTYRKARISQGLDKMNMAKKLYTQTIENGQNQPFYFACKAALEMGIIHEQEKAVNLAAQYFKKCLSIKPEEYKNSLHQQAKAGLNRLKKS